jgi:hypothetical protein
MSHATDNTEPAATSKKLVSRTATDTVAAPPATVWQILSDDFLEISTWAGGVRSSKANPATPTGFNGSPHGGRVCDVDGIGITDERIVAFDPSQRTLTYTVSAKKIPFFVESMTSSWSVLPGSDDSHASISLTVTATTKGLLGRVGKIPLNKMISGAAPGLLADLKTWAETPDRTTLSGSAAS